MNRDEYSTPDLYLSSFLISLGKFKLKEVRDGVGNRKVFVLQPKPEQSQILKFYSGEGRVSALKLLEALQNLKSACYALRNEGEARLAVRT